MPRKTRLTLMVALIALSVIAVSFYAIADDVKTGCAGAAKACGASAGCGGGCAAKMAARGAMSMSRAYSGGLVKARIGGCGGECSVMIGVFKQANRLNPNASVSAQVFTAEGKRSIDLKQMEPGIFCGKTDLSGATKLGVSVSGTTLSDYVEFGLAPKASPCGQAAGSCGMKAGAGCAMKQGTNCPMKQAGCKATTAGKCSGMTAGGCATNGACRSAAAKTAACKCATCKCAPCKCK